MTAAPPNRSPLFRQKALDHLTKSLEHRDALRVSPPWTWSLFWVMVALFFLAILGSIMGKVEQNERGRGILRPSAGVRNLQAQTSGILLEAYAKSGDHLDEGNRILRIHSPQLESATEAARRKLGVQATQGHAVAFTERISIHTQIAQAQVKLTAQEAQLASLQGSVQTKKENFDRYQKLQAQPIPLISVEAMNSAKEELDSMVRNYQNYVQQVAATKQELTTLRSQMTRSSWNQAEMEQSLRIQYEAQQQNLDQTLIKAPVAGYLEALLAKPGDMIQAGQTVAKVIPLNSPLVVVAFVAEKDRSYLHLGDEAALELDAYPYSEFGTLRGRIVRISNDLASSYEVREALGEDAKLDTPSFRVEMTLLDHRPSKLKHLALRPGMFLRARYTLRKRSLIVIAFEPLRRWLE